MNIGSRQKICHGFTLMEVLVVLVLVSLISTLLMEGFGYVLRLRFNITQQIKKQHILELQEHWYRNLVAGLLPNPLGEQVLFKGNASQFEGQTISALIGPLGVPKNIRLTLKSEANLTALTYRETENNEWTLGTWDAQTAYFAYLDDQGNWSSEWPNKSGSSSTQLPLAIELRVDHSNAPIDWIIGIPSAKNPKPSLDELL